MANAGYQTGEATNDSPASRWGTALADRARAATPGLLFALRLWISICLALYIAFWLQLDNAYWAGTSAAAVCQPVLGASLRKGWFRMVGTVVGAVFIVVLNAFFPQDRVAFLTFLALWLGVCAFAATVMHNFASYAAALAGYTAAVIASDTLGTTGGTDGHVFFFAITRAAEIWIGIVCAGVVLAMTDFGGSRRQLATQFASLATEITGRFADTLSPAKSQLDTRDPRRELARRVTELDPAIDRAIGESSQLRSHSGVLQKAMQGLFAALDGWRVVATHLRTLPNDVARQEAEATLRNLPPELRPALDSQASARWMADPVGLRGLCEETKRTYLTQTVPNPSQRLLADQTAKLLAGIARALDGLTLLLGTGRPLRAHRGFKLSVPDWAPAFVNAGRAFVAVGAAEVFWVVSAWPSGATAFTWTAIVVVLLSPQGDKAYAGATAFGLGAAGAVVFAAVIKFGALPAFTTFPAFCLILGLYLIPAGFLIAENWLPAMFATSLGLNFVPLVAPANQMSYDTASFYNSALAIFVGCTVAPLSFRLLPPLSPALRTRRLLNLTLRDLRRLLVGPPPQTLDDWRARVFGRLAALPEDAAPLQRGQLLAALSVGEEFINLRLMSSILGLDPDLKAALDAMEQGDSVGTRKRLAQIDRRLSSDPGDEPDEAALILRARASVLALSDALNEHPVYFDIGDRR